MKIKKWKKIENSCVFIWGKFFFDLVSHDFENQRSIQDPCEFDHVNREFSKISNLRIYCRAQPTSINPLTTFRTPMTPVPKRRRFSELAGKASLTKTVRDEEEEEAEQDRASDSSEASKRHDLEEPK